MKKIRFLFLWFAVVAMAQAQEETPLNCDYHINEALFYLKGNENFKRDTIKSINHLKPCVSQGNARAKILLSRIYASQKEEKNHKKAFKILKELAKENHALAATDLGILYKYGIGCRLNFNKARKWFKKGAQLGNDKAAYSLGYLYLKGFGSIDQDYKKAVKWFKKSNYPMANYWLGVCYYYGYGLPQNRHKANELLGTNFETTTATPSQTTTEASAEVSEQLANNSATTANETKISDQGLIGEWSGKLLKFDWSGKHIEQKHDFSLLIQYDSIQESAVYSLGLLEQETPLETLTRFDNELYFDALSLELPHSSFKEEIPKKLTHQFLSAAIQLKNIGGLTFLTGTIESYVNDWNEAGAPLKMVLKKKETFSNSTEELSDEILMALSAQEDHFIQLYPNPIERDLIISYTLDTESYVEVKITDINAIKNTVVEKGTRQSAGKHRYYFNGANLERGIYVVTVFVNHEKKTRIIVKK